MMKIHLPLKLWRNEGVSIVSVVRGPSAKECLPDQRVCPYLGTSQGFIVFYPPATKCATSHPLDTLSYALPTGPRDH